MKMLVVMATVLWSTVANAQFWRAIGRGVIGASNGVQTIYGDSVSDRLLAGGTFLHILNESDTVLAFGQAAWNGMRWDSLATRIQAYGGEGAQQTFWFLRFQGRLYSCGGYRFFDDFGQVNRSFARLDESTMRWSVLECTNLFPGSGLLTLVPKEPQNTLYATGYIGSVCGYPESCVFRYDGTAFHPWPPFDLIPQGNDRYVGTIFDYKGKTYMTCALPDPVDGTGFVSFIRWNGSAWEHVPGWNTLSPIKDISIHNDTLYVAGTFSLADGGPGNLVARFDGENWSDMGGGLQYPPVPMSGVVWDLEWFHGDLLACGRFTKAGNADCTGIAKWNGQQWCTFPGVFLHPLGTTDAALYNMAIWRDSLYVCGGFGTIDGQPAKQVAQWIGGDAVADCSTVGVQETATSSAADGLWVTPLPGAASWAVRFPHEGKWSLAVYDATGRQVKHMRTGSRMAEVDLSIAAPGFYFLRATDERGVALSAKVLRP